MNRQLLTYKYQTQWSYKMDFLTLFLLGCLLLALSYDVHTFWRYYLVLYFCQHRRKTKPKKLLDENKFKVICLTTDLDVFGNMTKGRLLRECSAGQLEFRIENFLFDALNKCGASLTNEECHVTYTRPIRLFETFVIVAKIIYWDDENIYLKQSVVLRKDETICAEILTRQKLTKANTRVVFEHLEEKVEWPVNRASTFEDNSDRVKCVQRLMEGKSLNELLDDKLMLVRLPLD